VTDLNELYGTVTDGGGNRTWVNPGNANDGNSATYAQADGFAGSGIVYNWYLDTDLGTARPVGGFVLDADMSCSANHALGDLTFWYSDNGTTWTQVAASIASNSGPISGTTRNISTWEFDDDHEAHRYWRFRQTRTVGGFQCTSRVYGFEVTEGVLPEPPPEPDPDQPSEPVEANVGALLEIYVAEEGAYLWDVALWDEAVWSSSEWVDITYLGVVADISWGADNPERGVLARTTAASWQVDTHDPDRILDPANEGSQFYPELVPGLPIRLSIAGRRVVRTGQVDTMSYSHAAKGGRIRASDNIARMAGATVTESDLGGLPDTLWARIAAAIAAVGLDIQLIPPPSSGDPDLAPLDVTGDMNLWTLVAESALEALYTPYVNEHNVLHLRPWLYPRSAGVEVASPELIDLVSFVSDEGLYSAVRVNDATALDTIALAVTPPPRYGYRVYDRTTATIDGEAWAAVVLDDRAATSLRWRPGQIRPLNAARVEAIAKIEHNEIISLYVPEANPDVEVRARVLGHHVRVIDLGGRVDADGNVIAPNTVWRWDLAATTGSIQPLVDDDDPLVFLVDDDDGVTLLYPDGVA
jgi:hypothetical protein